ncbi:flagellar biosynthesis protein FlhA [Simkania negevensis]|uniref:Flagellar biosynthesis protein FlhA n=1 Tax=Simkania negevensis TaxID=83561 RepID=A0ABS3AQP0_9BACT|nr:flagellar biosynthesis protein FlhA [Simkania negevensis]
MLNLIADKMGMIRRHGDIVLAVAVVGMVLVLIIPMPPVLLDAFLSISIVMAVTTLLLTLYVNEALEFNSFPTLLLFLTLFRLGLNIASTRLILSEAQAGEIIETFGEFVTGGNEIVGVVIFILLTVINFVVITKGAGRVAEVAARFTLDSMPGKQMSIDADLNAGLIDEDEARTRREKITDEADFYGSMDGASKFVRGDAIAGIVITVVNILGGFIIGMAMKGMDWKEAVKTYTVLTIGDGLVTQIPALLISVGAGIIVTRASSKENLAATFSRQIFNNPRVLFVTAMIIVILSFVPGMPMLVMVPIGAVIALYALVLWRAAQKDLQQLDATVTEANPAQARQQGESVEKSLFVDPMEIELGYGLIPIVDETQGGDLLGRITVIRRQVASELGLVVPPIRIRDNMALNPNEYVIKIRGIEVAQGTLYLDSYLAMNPGNVEKPLQGTQTIEPAFGLPATWIAIGQKENADRLGYTVVDTLSVLATHLTEVIHAHAHELLTRQEVQRLIDNAKEFASAVIEELTPQQLNCGQIGKVLQNLLHERVPIRDIATILEKLADHVGQTKDVNVLTEYVRQGLARSISKQYAGDDKKIHAITLDSRVEEMIVESVQKDDYGNHIVLRPSTVAKIVQELHKYVDLATKQGVQPVVLTSSVVRMYFKQLIERNFPRLPVLSYEEIVPEIEIHSLGVMPSEVLM